MADENTSLFALDEGIVNTAVNMVKNNPYTSAAAGTIAGAGALKYKMNSMDKQIAANNAANQQQAQSNNVQEQDISIDDISLIDVNESSLTQAMGNIKQKAGQVMNNAKPGKLLKAGAELVDTGGNAMNMYKNNQMNNQPQQAAQMEDASLFAMDESVGEYADRVGNFVKSKGVAAKNATNNFIKNHPKSAKAATVAALGGLAYGADKLHKKAKAKFEESYDIEDISLTALDEADYYDKEAQLRAKNSYKALKDKDNQNKTNANFYKRAGQMTRLVSVGSGIGAGMSALGGNYKNALVRGAVSAGTHVASNLLRDKARKERYGVQ